MSYSIRVRYLDASALVKLVVDEGDCEPLRTFYNSNCHFCATSVCLVEALGVIKGKWLRKSLTEDQYIAASHQLIANAQSIEIDNVELFAPASFNTLENLVRKYQIDFSDALQLETIIRGTYSHFTNDSASVLITADKGLADAAEKENIRVWNCIKSLLPDWV